jgi:hypothetical protein
MTTHLDVLFRYELDPAESAWMALAKVREVYGIRRIKVDGQEKTIRVEFDFTRLTRDVVARLLRGAGIAIVEEISLLPPQPPPPPPAEAAAPPASPAK